MDDMSTNDATPVIRTDFTDDAAWKKIQRDVAAINIMGFSANVRFIDERQYSGLTGQELLQSPRFESVRLHFCRRRDGNVYCGTSFIGLRSIQSKREDI